MPVCAHTRTSDFGGPSDGGHTGLLNFRWWSPVCFANLPVCHPFIENNFNICSHFIAFSRLSMNYHLDNLNISYLIGVLSHCCYSFGYMNRAQRENFWGWFFGISGHTVTFWLVMMVIRAACMSDGDGSQILTKWWMVIISEPPFVHLWGHTHWLCQATVIVVVSISE